MHLREVVAVDFEFEARSGERPVPVCLVAHELYSGRHFRLFQEQFGPVPPFATGPDVLFVAFEASAELGCYRVLNWPMPDRVLDLRAEFRNYCNGVPTPSGKSLLGALVYFGLDTMNATEKKEMQEAIGDGTWRERFSPEEVLNYCEGDVRALQRLLPVMLPHIDMPRALLRGRYMAASAAMEHNGSPIDVPMLESLREHWTDIHDDLIADIDKGYGVFEGRSFRRERWGRWLTTHGIPWPMLESGQLDLDDETFRQMAKAYPAVAPMRELRHALSSLRLNDLSVGKDAATGRSCGLSLQRPAAINRAIPNLYLVLRSGSVD